MDNYTELIERLYKHHRDHGEDCTQIFFDESGVAYHVSADGSEAKHIVDLLMAESQGRLVVLPCNPDSEVTLHHPDGYDYQADHWNIYLTVTRKADTSAGYKIHLLSIEEVEAVLKGGAE